MRHLRHLRFPLKTDASEFLCEIMNAWSLEVLLCIAKIYHLVKIKKINIITLFVHVLWVIDGIMGQSCNICRVQCLIKYDTYLQVRSIIHKTYGKIKKIHL